MAPRTTLEEARPAKTAKAAKKPAAGDLAKTAANEERERVFDAFRRWGYLEATLDPLGLFEPQKQPELEALTGEAAGEARRFYCGTVGSDFMHIPELERRRWIAERLEPPPGPADQQRVLQRLIRRYLFQQPISARHLRPNPLSPEGL